MIVWSEDAPAGLHGPRNSTLRSIHRRRPRWPLLTFRRAQWSVAVNLCHSRGPGHAPVLPPANRWRQGCCGACWEDAEAWLSSRV